MTKVVATKKAAKRQQTEELERIHGEIKDILTDAKKYFQKLSEKDLAVLGENLQLFSMNLEHLQGALHTYHLEMETQQKINKLQRYVDQGLNFTYIEVYREGFCLQDTKNGPKVIPAKYKDDIYQDDFPF
jgi:predicted component of viral defense system (DUF524 family)